MLPFLTYAGGKMEERCIFKNPNVSSLSQVLLSLLGAGNLLINFCFGRIVRTKRNNELQTHPQQNALKTHVGCLLSDLQTSSSSVWRIEPEIVTLQVILSVITNTTPTNEWKLTSLYSLHCHSPVVIFNFHVVFVSTISVMVPVIIVFRTKFNNVMLSLEMS